MPHQRSARHPHVVSRCLLYGALLTLTNGCQPGEPDAVIERYPPNFGPAEPAMPPTAHFARPRVPPNVAHLQLDIPLSTLDALEFVSLSGCHAQTTISKRSSILGQHAKPSQRLLLELEYLRLAPQCIALLRNRKRILANVLEVAWHEPKTQLPALVFNATLGSDEFHSFWLAPRVLGDYPTVSSSEAMSALTSINRDVHRWLNGDYDAHNRDFEILLSEVAGGNAGKLLQTLFARNADLLHCDSAAERLVAVIKALETRLQSVLPQPYQHWMIHRDNQLTAAIAARYSAPLRHTAQLCALN